MHLGQVRGPQLFLTRYHPGHGKKGTASFWIGIGVFGINNASIISVFSCVVVVIG